MFLFCGDERRVKSAQICRTGELHFGRSRDVGCVKSVFLANLAAQEHRGTGNPAGADRDGIAITAHNAFFTAGIGLFCPQFAPVSPLADE